LKFIITSFGSLGDLNPCVGLGQALEARGHEVILAIPRRYIAFAESAGLKGHPIRPDIDPADRDVVRRVMDPFRGAEFLIREWLMPHVEESYEDLRAIVADDDILVSHPLTYAAPVLAEQRGLRWASTVLAPLGFFSRRDPPLMAVHPAMAALQRSMPRLYSRLVPLARVATRRWGVPVRTLRQRLGMPTGDDPVHGGQFSPHLNLAMFSRVLGEPQADWPPNTVVTGAVSYDAVHGGMPESLSSFLDAGPPPIVFTLGSSAIAAASAPRFYQSSIEAAVDVGARAVLLIGQHDGHRPETGGRSDVFVAEWAPHSELFSRAAVIVHQGGAGTLHTALASGRPMLIVPHAHDQGDNAVRAVRLGVARLVFPSQYRRATVRDHLEALLTGESLKERAAAVGAMVRAEHGAARAAEALDALAGRGSPISRLIGSANARS
jgi:UDP:flavonoid glycosyltransferase YjiC (YdhE family)